MPKIFLSPSTQEWNQYITGGTEEQYMNLLADEMEPLLRASGIDFTRNDPSRNVTGAIADSNAGNYDVHLALHTNAAGGDYAGKIQGVDIYYAPGSSYSRKLADIVVEEFKKIYPDPSKVRPVPTTSLGEVTRTNAVSILGELGYHDNPEDAEWIKTHLPEMAEAMTKALTVYFGIPYADGGSTQNGVVSTDGSNLNLRRYPGTDAEIIGALPNGTSLIILGKSGNWYIVKTGDKTGYVSADYVTQMSDVR
ncbi:MAG: SH3 domain-containing protein [Ruminococcus sp.]|jgi:N-acetylmuramoyl-L-alanine amidase|nr:SH3 domain-containing protein [Ruminococcus sp.]